MCGRFVLTEDHTGIYTRFHLWSEFDRATWDRLHKEGRVVELKPNYHIRPTNEVPVITNRGGERRVEMMRWGLIPSWFNPDKHQKRLIQSSFNARDDKLSGGMWRGPVSRSRCLIPASGFYEWPEQGGLPAYIHPENDQLFAFAGLYDVWKDPETEQTTLSCTIVTTEPNEFMYPLHWNPKRKRMPVILQSSEAETLWLDPATTKPDELNQLFGPIPWDGWTYHRVNKLPNDGKDDPSLLEPAAQQNSLL